MSRRQLSLEGNAMIRGPLLPSLLPEAKELAIVVGTIGPRLEKLPLRNKASPLAFP